MTFSENNLRESILKNKSVTVRGKLCLPQLSTVELSYLLMSVQTSELLKYKVKFMKYMKTDYKS